MESTRMTAGARFPALAWSTVSGEQLVPSEGTGWRVLIVYRGPRRDGIRRPVCKFAR